MKSINKSLLVAAVMSTALSALAQNPGGRTPDTGSSSADPANETPATNASGRTASDGTRGANPNVDPNAGMTTDANRDAANAQPLPDANRRQKRSFWDRLFGRNRHLDAKGIEAVPEGGTNTDSSGNRQDVQP